MRRVSLLVTALGLGAALILVAVGEAGSVQPPPATPPARPAPAARWIPSTPEAEHAETEPRAVAQSSGEWAEEWSEEEWSGRHEQLHDQAWEELVENLARAGHDPERFMEAMEVASVERWWAEEE